MMRICLLADIHGNPIALEAVLQDAEAYSPDLYLILGDIVDGFAPAEVLRQIGCLEPIAGILGNTDRYILSGEIPSPFDQQVDEFDRESLERFRQATASFAWTHGYLCASSKLGFLHALPEERRLGLPDGRTLLAVHASPGYVDGPGIAPYTTDAEMNILMNPCQVEVVCVGHTHLPFVRELNQVLVINPGSVSNPLAPDLRASYALLDATVDGLEVTHRRVAYDHQAVIRAIYRSQHPAGDFMVRHQLGRYTVEDQKRGIKARWYMVSPGREGEKKSSDVLLGPNCSAGTEFLSLRKADEG